MRISFGLGVVIAVTPVSAAAQEICASLDRIVQASREEPAFASVQAALERGEPPMDWPSSELCTVTLGVEVTCLMYGVPAGWQEIETCPDLVPVEPRAVRNRRSRGAPEYTAFTVSGLHLEYGSYCTVCVVIPYGFSITFAEP